MSLLEDVFLEDEAGEAEHLERVIEGYEDQPQSGSESGREPGSDEAEEEKRRVDPSESRPKRVVKNPRFVLNPARLIGPRGIHIIPEHFKDFKFKGKGHEKEDLDLVLKKLEHWAYRLYPKFKFEDCLKKIETLGKKREVAVNLHKIRTDQFMPPVDTVMQQDSSDSDTEVRPQAPEEDEFDKLLQQQIELARSTPSASRLDTTGSNFDSVRSTPVADSSKRLFQTPGRNVRTPMTAPVATSSPSISEEQRQRMIRNRQMAEEKRVARIKQNNTTILENSDGTPEKTKESIECANETINRDNGNDSSVNIRQKSNVIDSSEDDSEIVNVKQSISVDVHKTHDVEMIDSDNDGDVEKNTSVSKRNRKNVIDSSDDDDDVIAVKETVSVNVHCELDESPNEKVVSDKKSVDIDSNDAVVSDTNSEANGTKENMKSSVDYEKLVNKENIDGNIDIEENMNVDS